ncbi:MAG: hypothetical protein LBH92_05875 [Bacteroidales bacterium]|nr:hypothetical protein [Bacteroidales bacterium]
MKQGRLYTKAHIPRRASLLLFLYLFYAFCIAFFVHAHNKNGIIIVHSHPYKKNARQECPTQNHTHTDFEYFIIGQISNITSEELDLAWNFEEIVLPFLYCLDISFEQKYFLNRNYPYGLRAPPAMRT